MKLSYYVVTRDYGFAPNPFHGFCTLATCKPTLRKHANVGDWIVGMGSSGKESIYKGKMIYAMQVEEILTFDDYWNDIRFQNKKPVMNGSTQLKYGDNIYYTDENGYIIQVDSHHSLENGKENLLNLERDTRGEKVLISKKFWYFGKDAIEIPESLSTLKNVGRGYRNIHDHNNQKFIDNFVEWIYSLGGYQWIGHPEKFESGFHRYDGRSSF